MAASEGPKSSSSADSYIGSLISLTSKSEIRYEGVLYSINTEESSIGLRNVRSFGTEGRKKDGLQVPPGDKVYEYILFRGSDIKDLQVKSSLPVQTSQTLNNDPAIIQSHYPHPSSTSTTLAAPANPSLTNTNSQFHTAQMGLPGSSFPSGLPLYQPGGNLGSWVPSPLPPAPNGNGLTMPMYWPGFYGPPSDLPNFHHQSLLRPPPGLSMHSSMQYPGFTTSLSIGASNLPEYPSHSIPSSTGTGNMTSTSALPSNLPSVPLATQSSETFMQTKAPISAPVSGSMTSLPPFISTGLDINVIVPPLSENPNLTSGLNLPRQTVSNSVLTIIGTSESVTEATAPSSPEPSAPPVPTDAQPPILPLSASSRAVPKVNGSNFQVRHGFRGRERGRGIRGSPAVMKFTEEFDFLAMNEKFNKDEVWGDLGKNRKSNSRDKEEDGDISDKNDYNDEDDAQTPVKTVYSKDDFFDSLSSNALDRDSYVRTKFSEQMKIDTETFGDFSRYQRGGGFNRSGGSRGGYYGRGYGYNGRGRGRIVSTHAN